MHETHDSTSPVSFPCMICNTIEFATASASRGSILTASCSATSASDNRPRCNSATAWLISVFEAEVDGA